MTTVEKRSLSRSGLFVFQSGEEGCQAVVIVLTPLLIGMMMALGALEAHSEEHLPHILHALLFSSDVAIPRHGWIVADGACRSQDIADEIVVGPVCLEGLANPFVEGVCLGPVAIIPALVAQDGGPLAGEVVSVTAAVQESVNDAGPLVR